MRATSASSARTCPKSETDSGTCRALPAARRAGLVVSPMRILAVNCGSSSIKCAVISGAKPAHSFDLRIEKIGGPEVPDIGAALDALFAQLRARWSELGELDAVAHRIVHGGERFTRATLLDDATLDALGALDHLAPLHNPPALEAVRREIGRASCRER